MDKKPGEGYRTITAMVCAALVGLYVIKYGGDLNEFQIDIIGRLMNVFMIFIGGLKTADAVVGYAKERTRAEIAKTEREKGFHNGSGQA